MIVGIGACSPQWSQVSAWCANVFKDLWTSSKIFMSVWGCLQVFGSVWECPLTGCGIGRCRCGVWKFTPVEYAWRLSIPLCLWWPWISVLVIQLLWILWGILDILFWSTATILKHNNPLYKHKFLSWCVSLPTMDLSYWASPFFLPHIIWLTIQSVILWALSISLELGISVTLKFVDATVPPLSHGCKNAKWRPGTIVYIGTYDNGHQEALGIAN